MPKKARCTSPWWLPVPAPLAALPQQLALALLLGSALGVVVGVAHRLRRVRHPELPAYFAYGPALWLGVPAAYAVAPLLSG